MTADELKQHHRDIQLCREVVRETSGMAGEFASMRRLSAKWTIFQIQRGLLAWSVANGLIERVRA